MKFFIFLRPFAKKKQQQTIKITKWKYAKLLLRMNSPSAWRGWANGVFVNQLRNDFQILFNLLAFVSFCAWHKKISQPFSLKLESFFFSIKCISNGFLPHSHMPHTFLFAFMCFIRCDFQFFFYGKNDNKRKGKKLNLIVFWYAP